MKRESAFPSILLVWCAALLTSHVAKGDSHGGFTIVSQTPQEWSIEYRPQTQPSTFIDIDGTPHILFQTSANLDGGFDRAGEPLLPIDLVTFGVPPRAVLHVELVDPVYETVPNQLVAPLPTYSLNEDQHIVAGYVKNAIAYGQNKFFPGREFVIDPPARLRDQWIASVRLSPYMYNPATKVLRRLVEARLIVTLKSKDGEPLRIEPSSPAPDPLFEETYRRTMINYQQAKEWRVQKERTALRPDTQDPTRDWFETGKYYYKIPIADDAWYRVTKAQLVAAGANPSQIDVPTMKMFHRGVQIPIVVRPDTSVEFHGRRNYGDSAYTDFFTDTTAFWLTWGGAPGLRFTPSFVDSLSPVSSASSSMTMRHFEQNNYYYQGTTIPEVINVETVPGEGWAWGTPPEWFFPNTTREYEFQLDNVDTLSSSQATMRIRLVSTTLNYTTPNHRARFWLLDSISADGSMDPWPLGEATFAGRASVVHTVSFPHTYLKNGRNVLRIQSINTGAVPNQFYLDWFEADYVRNLRAQSNQLLVTVPAPGQPGRTTFRVTGFSSSQIDVFELATKRQITSVQIIPTGGEEYEIAFRDSLLTSRLYAVVAGGGARTVSSVSRKMFADIRVNPQGADYIVISHKNFLAAAQQLAAHRQALNGVRTKVIDVEEIYDEFNYGIVNGTKLKPFIKHAYDTWPLPRPTYLLMFGDACWDFRRFLSTSINTNYVPSYGVPVTDNWYVSFNPDSGALPFMFVGRLPVNSPRQASETAMKIIKYDSYELSEWNKNFLFITGGNDPGEQSLFNSYSEFMIGTKINPAPIAGAPFRVYKNTRGAIDGEHKTRLKELVRTGMVFMNFIGHSGGRIWGVDIGPPSELENTNGKLPFVASTSCNVGGFGEPSSNVLAEDFLLAEQRGAIASWASSTLGFPGYGKDLSNDFLQGIRDSVRTFGALTTNARIKMLRLYGNEYISTSTVHTNNLLGDPLSRFALPLRPDLAITSQQLIVSNPTPSTNDSLVPVKVKFFNFGLVPPDSVGVTVTDVFSGQTTTLLNNRKLAPTRLVDSIIVDWRGTDQVGVHTLTATLDPENRIIEVNELNNIASRDQYVYANVLSVVKPIRNMVVPPGVVRLVVSSPIGIDSTGFAYEFELDTVDTFNSPALVTSGSVAPFIVTGEWSTPSLGNNQVYFWRARTRYPQIVGNWVVSSFSTSSDVPVLPTVRWRERTSKQFRRNHLHQVAATDSGVTIAATPPINLYVRSVGTRYNQLAEYYSIIKVNEQQIRGYFFEPGIGTSYLAMRLNDFTGIPEFRTFNTAAFPPDTGLAEARRMIAFINGTPVGNYLAFSVIFDGASGVTESLKVALEQLGSTRIRQVQPFMSYVLVGRKGSGGPGMPALESLTNDTAIVSLNVPNLYSRGSGSIGTMPMFIAPSWGSFHVRASGQPATNIQTAFVGVRPTGAVDTLRIFPRDSSDIDLGFLNDPTSGARYNALQTVGLLSTSDATLTPSLREWWMNVVAPADLAISARTIAGDEPSSLTRNIEVTVYNIGYQDSDSSNVVLSIYDRQNRARPVASVSVQPIAMGASRTMIIPISTHNLQRRVAIQATVNPAKRAKDLVLENNTAYYTFQNIIALTRNDVKVYMDGVQVMEGDYVPASPTLMLQIPKRGEEFRAATQVKLFVDNRYAGEWQSSASSPASREEPSFTPGLSDGYHQLRFHVTRVNAFGEVDTLEQSLGVNVLRESRIMQMYNYPNPFRSDTYITLMLTGSEPPEELTLRIYTIAGRKIREISVPSGFLRVGFNRIYWDGRDADGDEVANGYYLYQVTMKSSGASQTEMQRLAKVR